MQTVQSGATKHTAADFTSSPRLQRYLAQPEKLDRIAGFRRWLGVFLMEHGQYKITQKGYAELAPESGMGRKSARAAVGEIVGTLIREGKASELFDSGQATRRVHADWSGRSMRMTVLGEFVGIFEDPKKMEWGDFSVAGLSRLLDRNEGSPYLTFVELGIAYSQAEFLEHARTNGFKAEKFYPWEMRKDPHDMFDEAKNRIAAVKWLLWKTKKPVIELGDAEFREHIPGLYRRHYNESPYLAFAEAGFAYTEKEIAEHLDAGIFGHEKLYPWQLKQTPNGFFKNKAHRIAAMRWVASKTSKRIEETSERDLEGNGLRGLYFGRAIPQLIEEALPAAA